MTETQLKSDLEHWASEFKLDLEMHLAKVHEDPNLCGFAIELPSDFGNDVVVSRVAKRDDPSSPVPDLDDWEYLVETDRMIPNCERLITVYEKYDAHFDDESFYDVFGNELYSLILSKTHELVSSGRYPNVAVWILTLSDDEHPILAKAAEVLNDAAMQETAKGLIE